MKNKMSPESRDFVIKTSTLFTFHDLTLNAVYLNIRVYGNDKMEIFVMICMPEELQTWHLFIL